MPASHVPSIDFRPARPQQAVNGPFAALSSQSKPSTAKPPARGASEDDEALAYLQPAGPTQPSPVAGSSPARVAPAGSVAPESQATKPCPFCGETILLVAKKCKHCGEYLNVTLRGAAKPTEKSSEALGIVIMLLPLASAALMWFWVGSMNLLQNPSSTLAGIVIFTVIVTSALMAVEASLLGMGGERDGKATTGPAGWFMFGLVLWLVALPACLYTRSKFGVKNYVVGGLISALLFCGVSFVPSCAIEEHKAEVRRQIQEATDAAHNAWP